MTQIDLSGHLALITGATGGIGEAVAMQFLQAGGEVAAVSRGGDKLARLAARLHAPDGRLHLIEAALDSPASARQALADVQAAAGRLPDSVIAIVGGWWHGQRLIDISFEDWQKLVYSRLTTHFALVQAIIPAIKDVPGSSYTFINGDAAHLPKPLAAPVAAADAASLALARALMAEHVGDQVRINVLLINAPVNTPGVTDPQAVFEREQPARYALYLASPLAQHVRSQVIFFDSPDQLPT